MRIMIFDTETTDINKCFCYNVGYVIYDTETETFVDSKEFVVEQIWHNLPLFSTAYYANKRQFYVKNMRAKKIKLDKIVIGSNVIIHLTQFQFMTLEDTFTTR